MKIVQNLWGNLYKNLHFQKKQKESAELLYTGCETNPVVPEKGVVDAAKSQSLSRHTQALLFGVEDIGAGKVIEGEISKIQRSFEEKTCSLDG